MVTGRTETVDNNETITIHSNRSRSNSLVQGSHIGTDNQPRTSSRGQTNIFGNPTVGRARRGGK